MGHIGVTERSLAAGNFLFIFSLSPEAFPPKEALGYEAAPFPHR